MHAIIGLWGNQVAKRVRVTAFWVKVGRVESVTIPSTTIRNWPSINGKVLFLPLVVLDIVFLNPEVLEELDLRNIRRVGVLNVAKKAMLEPVHCLVPTHAPAHREELAL